MLPFSICIDVNFNVQNDSDETITIKEKTFLLDNNHLGQYEPAGVQSVTSNGGKGHFQVTK